jgi:hypothetical protein
VTLACLKKKPSGVQWNSKVLIHFLLDRFVIFICFGEIPGSIVALEIYSHSGIPLFLNWEYIIKYDETILQYSHTNSDYSISETIQDPGTIQIFGQNENREIFIQSVTVFFKILVDTPGSYSRVLSYVAIHNMNVGEILLVGQIDHIGGLNE